MSKLIAIVCALFFAFTASSALAGGSHYQCEKIKKNGKHKVLKKIKSKRKCKKRGGKWVKHDDDHDHEHDHDDDHDHDHSHSH